MELEKTAQHIEVLEIPLNEEHLAFEPDQMMFDEVPELHTEIGLHELPDEIHEPSEADFVIGELPGVDELDPDLEHALEVSEKDDDKKDDKSDLRNDKPVLKWDWEARCKKGGMKEFTKWAKEILNAIPKHSGYDVAGIHRVISYLERFLDECSKAMKKDLDGELDANLIEKMCAEAEDGIERCNARLEKLKKSKSKKSKKADMEQEELIKTAQKTPNIVGVVITVPLFISRIARVIMNGMVSAGHDAEIMFDEQVKKYKLTDREQAELIQHLADMGMPQLIDRGYMRGEEAAYTKREPGFDFVQNFDG